MEFTQTEWLFFESQTINNMPQSNLIQRVQQPGDITELKLIMKGLITQMESMMTFTTALVSNPST